MDDIGSSVVVILVTALVIAGIFWFTNKSKKINEDALREMASQHGWTYTPIAENLAWGTSFTFQKWNLTVESRSIGQPSDSGSSNIQEVTRWQAELTSPARFPLWIGPRLSGNSDLSASFGIPFLSKFGVANLPPGNLKETDLGIPELTKRYVVLADPQMDPAVVRMTAIPHNLLEWSDKSRPLIIVSPDTIEITINGQHLKKPLDIERLVLLGEAVLSISQ